MHTVKGPLHSTSSQTCSFFFLNLCVFVWLCGQDAVELLCGMKQLPNVAFYDMWCSVHAHLTQMLLERGVQLGSRAGQIALAGDDRQQGSVAYPITLPPLREIVGDLSGVLRSSATTLTKEQMYAIHSAKRCITFTRPS
jgi:hypothetical protein